MLFLRGGYKFNVDAENFSLGVGLKIPISFAKANLDYSIANYRDLGFAQRFSINLMLQTK